MMNINNIIGGSIQTNSYLLEDDYEIICIDFVPKIENIIKENNYKISKILLTHIHFDHVEKLSEFQKKYNFELCLSKHAYDFLKNPDQRILSFFPQEYINNYKNIKLNNSIILKDNDTLKWKENELKIIETPGHSQDCLVFISFDLKTVFTGDTIFYGSVGRTDLPGGNYNTMIDSIKKIFLNIDDDFILLPGHGPGTNVLFEKQNNPFLKEIF